MTYDLIHWTTFLSAAVLLNIAPGPDMAFILGHTVKSGAKAGTARPDRSLRKPGTDAGQRSAVARPTPGLP